MGTEQTLSQPGLGKAPGGGETRAEKEVSRRGRRGQGKAATVAKEICGLSQGPREAGRAPGAVGRTPPPLLRCRT